MDDIKHPEAGKKLSIALDARESRHCVQGLDGESFSAQGRKFRFRARAYPVPPRKHYSSPRHKNGAAPEKAFLETVKGVQFVTPATCR